MIGDLRPTVVLATGQLLTTEIWEPQVRDLAPDFDLRFADHGRDDNITDMAERLLREAPARFDLVAHAMGGFIAFEAFRLDPARVRSLVLMSTLASADNPTQTERRQNYIRLVEAGRFEEVVEERIPILVHPARREDESLLRVVRRMAHSTGADRFLAQQRAIMSRRDARPLLSSIDAPVLILHGADDGIVSSAHQDEMVQEMQHAELRVIEACGHLLSIEKPMSVSSILRDWLSRKRDL